LWKKKKKEEENMSVQHHPVRETNSLAQYWQTSNIPWSKVLSDVVRQF